MTLENIEHKISDMPANRLPELSIDTVFAKVAKANGLKIFEKFVAAVEADRFVGTKGFAIKLAAMRCAQVNGFDFSGDDLKKALDDVTPDNSAAFIDHIRTNPVFI